MNIQNLEIIKDCAWTRIQADVSWGKNIAEKVFFAVPSDYMDMLDYNSVDAFVIAFVQIAAKYDENIIIEGASVSEQLAKNIELELIPVLAQMGCGKGMTKIIAQKSKTEAVEKEKIGATGISLGVDSFYSILSNISERNQHNPIKATVYIHQVKDFVQFDEDELNKCLKSRKKVSEELRLDLIPIVTNVRHIMEQELAFSQFHTFCHIASIVSIKNKIGYYYYATGYSENEMSLNFADSAYYENVLQNVFSYGGFRMYSSGEEITRYEKTKTICTEKIVQKYLDVCLHDRAQKSKVVNCSCCTKCVRTMTTLDVLGQLDDFNHVFDLSLYHKHFAESWADVEYRRIIGKNHFAIEIHKNAVQAGYKIPRLAIFYMIKKGIINQYRKIRKK